MYRTMGNTAASNSANAPCMLSIVLDPPPSNSYVAGQTISGSIYAKAKSNVPAGNNISIRAYLSGKERSCVSYTELDYTYPHLNGSNEPRRVPRYAHAERNIVHMAINLADLSVGIKANARYRFPFIITLPHDLPSSMRCAEVYGAPEDSGYGYCSITYKIKAELQWFGSTYKVQKEINILSAPMPSQPVPRFITPVVHDVNFCCCFGQGSLVMGAGVGDTRIGHGESADVDFACKNLTERTVVKTEAEIREKVTWVANGERNDSSRIIAFKTFPRTERWKQLTKSELSEFKASDDQNQRMLRMLHKAIKDADNRRSLAVRRSALHSYNSSIITVEHQLVIKVTTSGFSTTNPEIKLPVFIGTPSALLGENTPAVLSLPEPPSEWADGGKDPSIIVNKPVEVGPSNAVLGGAKVKEEGGLYCPKGDESDDEGDIIVPPLQERLDPTYQNLRDEMKYAINPISTVRYRLDDAGWKEKVFKVLTPTQYFSIIKAVSIEFDQPEMAETIAPAIDGGNFTHQYIIAVIRGVSEWLRICMLQRLLPYCKDLDQNKKKILSYLSDWERICTKKYFEDAVTAQ